jgi:Fic family protein
MLKQGYWAFRYLSISEWIKKAPGQYAMSYIYSEQDDNDLNYFLWYNISRIKHAREDFLKYVTKKISENRNDALILKDEFNFNDRQLSLVHYLAKDEQRYTTLSEYINANDIGKVTATNDLRKLVESSFLKRLKRGRNVYYRPTDKLFEIIYKIRG